MSLNRPLRFCMITTFYPPHYFGGDAIYVYRLAQALAEEGHAVDVIHSLDAYRLRRQAEPSVAFEQHPNVTVYPLESKSPRSSALAVQQTGRPAIYSRQLRDIFDANAYDVIHYHNISLTGGPEVLRWGKSLKLYTAHDYWLICAMHVLFTFNQEACTKRRCLRCTLAAGRPPQLWRYTGTLKRCLRHVDCMILPSDFALQRHRDQGIDGRMEVLPSLVPVDDGAVPGDTPPVPERPYFFYAGRLEKLKGVQDLIDLFRDYRGADLLIAGDGAYEDQLRGQARGLDHVRFLGRLHPSALGRFYSRAVAVLVPSLCYETFGLSAAEALAHGTPAIVRGIGAVAEVVEQQGAGLTFTTLPECRGAMEKLLHDTALRATLGERGREAWRQNWSTEIHLRRYLSLIEDLAEDKPALSGEGP